MCTGLVEVCTAGQVQLARNDNDINMAAMGQGWLGFVQPAKKPVRLSI